MKKLSRIPAVLACALFFSAACGTGSGGSGGANQDITQESLDRHVFNTVANGMGDIWNQHLRVLPAGQINTSGPCPRGGTFTATGSDSVPAAGTNTIDLDFQMTGCKISSTYSSTLNGAPFIRTTDIALDGVITWSGTITNPVNGTGTMSLNMTYTGIGLKISGTDSATGYNDSTIDETCDYSALYSTDAGAASLTGTMCGRPVTVTFSPKLPGNDVNWQAVAVCGLTGVLIPLVDRSGP